MLLALAIALLPLAAHADRRDDTFQQCCTANGIGKDCGFALCHYDTDVPTVTSDGCPFLRCYKKVPIYIRCATDFRDASSCYDENEIPEFCRDTIGSGEVPSLNSLFEDGKNYIPCVRYMDKMLQCHKKEIPATGHENVCLENCHVIEESLESEKAIKNFLLFSKFFRKTCRDQS